MLIIPTLLSMVGKTQKMVKMVETSDDEEEEVTGPPKTQRKWKKEETIKVLTYMSEAIKAGRTIEVQI